MRRMINIMLSIMLICMSLVSSVANAAEEHLFKAAYIYNFAKFTRWPNLSQKNTTISLCTAGNDDLVRELKRLEDKIIKGRRFLVKDVKTNNSSISCQLLYIATSEKEQIRRILNEVKDKPILTISALPEFEKNGGMVQMYTRKNKTRIIINLSKVRGVNL